MPALVVDGAELKPALWKRVGRGYEVDFPQAEAGVAHVAQAGLGPCVVNRHQEDNVVGNLEPMCEETANLAPWRIGDNPID